MSPFFHFAFALFLPFAFLLFTLSSHAYSYNINWSKTNGPYGGWLDFYLHRPGTIGTFEDGNLSLYLATNSRGVARSFNGGNTWKMMAGGYKSAPTIESSFIFCLAFSPESSSVIYAGAYASGLWMSSDKGDSWRNILPGKNVCRIAPNKNDPNIVYALTDSEYYAPIYKVYVNTATKESLPFVTYKGESLRCSSIIYDGYLKKLYASMAGNYPTLYRQTYSTTNDGATWTMEAGTVFDGYENVPFFYHVYESPPTSEAYLWMVYTYVKNEYNPSWVKDTGVPLDCNDFAVFNPSDRNFIITCSETNGQIMKTTNHGVSWSTKAAGLPPMTAGGPYFYPVAIIPNPGGSPAVILRSSNGVYVSLDGGETFLEINGQSYASQASGTAFINTSIKCLAVDEAGTVYAGGRGGNESFSYTNDGHGAYKSTDKGVTWKRIHNGLLGTAVNSLAVQRRFNPDIIYLANENGIFKSVNSGDYWGIVSNLETNCLGVDGADRIYAGTNGNGVYLGISGEAGADEWFPLPPNSLSDPTITSICFDNDNNIYVGTQTGGIFKHIPGSSTWEVVDAPEGGVVPGPICALAVDSAESTYIFAGTNAGGIYRKIGTGLWATIEVNAAATGFMSFYIDTNTIPHTIFVAGYDGLYSNAINGTSGTWGASGQRIRDYAYNLNSIVRDASDGTFYVAGDNVGVSKGIADVPVPSAPENFRGSAESSTVIRWLWTDNATNEFGYRLIESPGNTIVATLAASTTKCVESNLIPNTYYYRYAQAYNNVGASSSVSSECTHANPPTNLRKILPIGGDYVTLNWDTNSNTSGTKYIVKLATLESGPFIDYASFETNPAQSIEGLATNKPYWFKVYAINHNGITTESSNVASAETTHETNPPRIYNIRFDGIPLFDNDVVRSNPLITADITDEAVSPEAFSPVSKEATTLDFSTYYIILGADLNSFTFSTAEGVYKLSHRLSVPLGAGTYTFYITAADALGNVGTSTPRRVRVMSGGVATVGPILTTPTPFKPATEGGMATIAYTLSTDAPVDIYMYDIAGKIVMRRKFEASTNGGRTGYNEVKWNGTSDFGKIVGNGIYVYKIISKGKVIGKGKIVVYD